MNETSAKPAKVVQTQGPWADLALHTIGWKAFQDLCSHVCEVILRAPVEIYQEAQDGGQDAVFLIKRADAPDAVGTVQCKHSSDPKQKLRLSDLNIEIAKVKELVALGQAHSYIFMTSMGVDAPEAVKIRLALLELGVKKPHVFGKQFLVRTIRSSSKLRALVPQVYGLGDLSIILDERLISQTRALLKNWLPVLERYVPTGPHQRAVKALVDHGAVLLLGNPSTGKSTIGAILSTIECESLEHTVIQATSPKDLIGAWNPEDKGRFFWIDDAFGPNTLREDYVQDWTEVFRKVEAAIGLGNKFLFTSRRHIYIAAKARLGTRNLSVFADESAVVQVGDLTQEEKEQILRNHIRFGNQTAEWKQKVKPFLKAATDVGTFLPGVAERLGDPNHTKSLPLHEAAIVSFMDKPEEHLVKTINELDPLYFAALLLVYVHQSKLVWSEKDQSALDAVADLTGVATSHIFSAFEHLQGSFVKRASVGASEIWSFSHPTISDALTTILKGKPQMLAALLRGVSVQKILSDYYCESQSNPFQKDAPTIPHDLDDVIVARILRAQDDSYSDRQLFRFLSDAANDDVFVKIVIARPELLERSFFSISQIWNNSRISTLARAHRLQVLPHYLKDEAEKELKAAALKSFDLSFFESDEMLALLSPKTLIELGFRLRSETLLSLEPDIEDLAENADLDETPESHFEYVKDGVNAIKSLVEPDDQTEDIFDSIDTAIVVAIDRIQERIAEQDRDERRGEWRFSSSVPTSKPEIAENAIAGTARSIFSDVDS